MVGKESFLKVAVRNEILGEIFEEKDCYREIGNLEVVDNDDYVMIIVGDGIHGQAPMNLDGVHKGLMEILSKVPELAGEISSKNSQIRAAYEFVQWSDEEDEYNEVQFHYIHGYADYTEKIDDELDTMELYEGIAKPRMALYAKSGSEWSILSKVDFKKYGVEFNEANLSGKKVFTFGYEDGWKPDAKMIEALNKDIENALSAVGTADMLYVICHPIMDAYRFSYYFGTKLHNNDYGEDLERLMDVDSFFEGQPDLDDIRAVVKTIAGTLGEDGAITEEEWEKLNCFGLDTDAIQEENAGEFLDMLGSMKDMLETMKNMFGNEDDDEDDEE